jgi:hypothetical protein
MQNNQLTATEPAESFNRLERKNELPPGIEPAADDNLAEYRDAVIEPPQKPYRVPLNPPVTFDGVEYKELVFDFDNMIGKDFQRAERTFTKLYKADKNETVLPEMKHLYHCIIAAQVGNYPLGLIMKLPRRQYNSVRLEALKACGSSPEEEKA